MDINATERTLTRCALINYQMKLKNALGDVRNFLQPYSKPIEKRFPAWTKPTLHGKIKADRFQVTEFLHGGDPPMELNLEDQKQRFLDICHSTIHRDGLEALLDWLCKVDFFDAPASTKYHGAYAGGLCQHSLDVYDYAKKLVFLSPVPISDESLAIASLFHDVCKCNLYKTEYRNQKINGEWQQVPVFVINERFHFGGHGSKSVYQVQYFMKLEPTEAAAINCHMGFSDGSPTTMRDVGNAYQDNPLAWIIHVADEAATYLLER